MKALQRYLPALLLQLFILAPVMLAPVLSHAQLSSLSTLSTLSSDSVDPVIATASSLLQQLDRLAEQCQQNSPESDVCSNFLQAIDGELIADYLDHCSRLTNWKEDMLAQALSVDTDIPNSSTQLRRIARVESLCNESSLKNNTQFVFATFNELKSQDSSSGTVSEAISRRITDLEFSILENAERRSLQNSFQQEQSRRQLETQQQINSQQNDLLRKQMERQQTD